MLDMRMLGRVTAAATLGAYAAAQQLVGGSVARQLARTCRYFAHISLIPLAVHPPTRSGARSAGGGSRTSMNVC